MYAAHARAIANAQTSNDLGQEIADFKIKIKGKIPGKDVFISKFKLLNYLNSRQRDVVRYTLWKLDKSRCPAIDMERDSASIEHILPQATNRTYTAQGIGNLILVPVKFIGERLGAKSFLDKKNELVSGGYPMEDLMLKATAWTSKEIEERASALAEYAYDIAWKIK
jgi:hypothetical protein